MPRSETSSTSCLGCIVAAVIIMVLIAAAGFAFAWGASFVS